MQGIAEKVRIMEATVNDRSAPSRKSKWIKLAIAVAAIALLLAAGKYLGVTDRLQAGLVNVLEWIKALGAWGPVIFILTSIAGYIVLPGAVLTAAAGLLFGVPLGTACVSIASVTGATLAFLIGRYFARAWVAGKIENNSKFKAIDEAVAREGWKIVGLTRLSPAFPFIFLNYAYGLTRVSLRDFVLASWIGMLPGTIMYVYLGSLAENLASLGAGGKQKSGAEWALLIVGLIATIVVTVFVTRIARRALSQKVAAGEKTGEAA